MRVEIEKKNGKESTLNESQAISERLGRKVSTKMKKKEKEIEISRIMKLPEVKEELLKRANPHLFDLYRCAFEQGGELQVYAEHIRQKLMQLNKNLVIEDSKLQHKLLKVASVNTLLVK